MYISRDAIYCLLRECSKKRDLRIVRQIRSLIYVHGFVSVTMLCDQLIRLFSECGSLDEANQVFRDICVPSVFTWNAILSAHEQHGEYNNVLCMYHAMHAYGGVVSDPVTFISVLKACSNSGELKEGMLIHGHILETLHYPCMVVGNTLMNMYAKCEALDDAWSVFDRLSGRNVVSWGVILTGYSANGFFIRTLELFELMKDEGIEPSRVTYICALKACSNIKASKRGRTIHREIVESASELDCVLGSTLVDMYAKCNSLEDAHRVFDGLSVKDIVAWSAIIVGYSQCGQNEISLKLFNEMKLKGLRPGEVAYSAALKASAGVGLRGIEAGRLMHDEVIKHGFDENTVVGSSIVDFYAKCGRLGDAEKIFNALTYRDPISWAAMIGGYSQNGHGSAALELFGRTSVREKEDIQPSKGLFLSLLKACCSIGDLYDGRLVHAQVIKNEMHSDPTIGNMLVDMYAKCGNLKEAHDVFDKMHARTSVSWGALITGHVLQNDAFGAVNIFAEVLMKELPMNEVIYLGVLKACILLKNLELARSVHLHIVEDDFALDIKIGNTVIEMYLKCGSHADATASFDGLPNRDMVTWGTMMMGYLDQGQGLPAFQLFIEMQKKGVKPDKMALMCSLKACSVLGAVDWGKWIHTHIFLQHMFEVDVVLACNLIEMYTKSGSIEDAQKVFDRLSRSDAATWGALVAGYASRGNFTHVRSCLQTMQNQGIQPNDVMFTSILASCSQGGLIREGFEFFQSMAQNYVVSPMHEHYSCVLDLLARSGRLDHAKDLLLTFGRMPDTLSWRSLLSSCRVYNKKDLAKNCFNEGIESGLVDASRCMTIPSVVDAVDDMSDNDA